MCCHPCARVEWGDSSGELSPYARVEWGVNPGNEALGYFLDRYFHSFARKHRIGEPFST